MIKYPIEDYQLTIGYLNAIDRDEGENALNKYELETCEIIGKLLQIIAYILPISNQHFLDYCYWSSNSFDCLIINLGYDVDLNKLIEKFYSQSA